MLPEIRTVPIEYTIAGYSLRHDPAKRFGEEIMTLLGRVWPVIKAGAIPTMGELAMQAALWHQRAGDAAKAMAYRAPFA